MEIISISMEKVQCTWNCYDCHRKTINYANLGES